MKGSVTKYAVKSSSRPRWRYRIAAGKDEEGKRIQQGQGVFSKEREARADGRWTSRQKREGQKTRRFHLSQNAIAALLFQREQQQECRRQFGGDYRDHVLVFAKPNGDFREPDLVSQVVIRCLRKSGITDASMHSLRHSNASNLISRGVPIPAVSARLGHADVSITNWIYAHAIPDDDLRAADEWDGLIDGPLQ